MTPVHTTGEVQTARRPGGRVWRALRLALGLVLSALGLWLAMRGVPLARAAALLGQARPGLLLAALVADLALVAAMAARWQSLFFAPHPARGRLFQILTIAQLSNAVLPARPGVLVRAHLAGRGRAGGTAAALTTIVGEKVAEGLGLCLVAVVLAPLVPALQAPSLETGLAGWLRLTVGVGSGLLLGVLALLIGLSWRRDAAGRWLGRVLRGWPWLLARIGEMLDALAGWRQPRTLLAVCFWSAVVWGLAAARSQLLLWCLDIQVPWAASLTIVVLSQVGSRLPASPAGIGVLHYASVLALSLFGVGRDVALGYGVLFHLLMYLPTSLLGLWFLARSGLGLRRLKGSTTGRQVAP